MAFFVRSICFTALFLSGAAASGQQAKLAAGSAAIVQPGAPGQSSKTLSPATAGVPVHLPAEPDINFMQGMIMHHGQAVEMVDLLRTHSHNKDLLAFGERIAVSQTDEIRSMKRWLEDRGEPVSKGPGPMGHSMGDMKGMVMDHANAMPMMPGMLTPQQMRALAQATGRSFDHLFLTGMIQHHTGALVMVEDLFNTPGAGQDNVLFDFANDVDNTQRAEIDIMQRMLLKEKR